MSTELLDKTDNTDTKEPEEKKLHIRAHYGAMVMLCGRRASALRPTGYIAGFKECDECIFKASQNGYVPPRI
jgi:hypothetical protein